MTRRDLEEFYKAQRDFKRTFPRCIIFGSLWSVVAVTKFLTAPFSNNIGFLYLLIAILSLGYVIVVPFVASIKMYRQESDWLISYEIDAIGTTITWIDCDLPHSQWKEYKRLSETTHLFLLFNQDDVSAQIIPKRAFANKNDLNQFRAWASQIGHEPAPNSPLPEIK